MQLARLANLPVCVQYCVGLMAESYACIFTAACCNTVQGCIGLDVLDACHISHQKPSLYESSRSLMLDQLHVECRQAARHSLHPQWTMVAHAIHITLSMSGISTAQLLPAYSVFSGQTTSAIACRKAAKWLLSADCMGMMPRCQDTC